MANALMPSSPAASAVTETHCVLVVKVRYAAPAARINPPRILSLPKRIALQCCRRGLRTSRRGRVRQHHFLDSLGQLHHAKSVFGADGWRGPAANGGDE